MKISDLRTQLRELGYDARPVNGDCFDIHQDGRVHYLSNVEAAMLIKAGAGIQLHKHATRLGLNYWYDFTRSNDDY